MPLDITKPAVIIFLNEMYEKEKLLRAQWNYKHRKQLQEAASLQREPTNYFEKDVVTQNMIGGMATITRDHASAGYNRRKVPLRDALTIPGIQNLRHDYTIAKVGLGDPKEDPRLARPDTNLSPDPVMHLIDPSIKKILYKPRPAFGREQYLKKRAYESPEKKYYFSECSNWDYGWRIGDSKMQQASEYGRRFLLDRTMRSRIGPQPDPSHYRSAEDEKIFL